MDHRVNLFRIKKNSFLSSGNKKNYAIYTKNCNAEQACGIDFDWNYSCRPRRGLYSVCRSVICIGVGSNLWEFMEDMHFLVCRLQELKNNATFVTMNT